MSPEILVIITLVLAPALVWVWKKWGAGLFAKAGQIELIKVLVESLKDGELTEAEARRIIEEIKKLVIK